MPAGRGRYVRELLLGLQRRTDDDVRYELWAREPWGDLDPRRFTWRLVGLPDPFWHLAVALRATPDVFLSTNSYLTAWATRVPTVVAVMDMVSFLPGAAAQQRAARIERATLRPAVRRAKALPCISQATKDDLVARYPSAAPKASVIWLAADERFSGRPGPPPIEGRYVLAVGTVEPRKNLERLIAAWTSLDLDADVQLALVGPKGWDDDSILAAAARVPSVRMLGKVSDEELHALYAGCECFVFPSLYEGFGLPIVEAMAAGAPVLTSDVSSMPEVAGDAALLVDPRSTDAIAEGLKQLLTDAALRERLRAAGRERAKQFSWDRCAAEHLDLLRSVR